MNIEPNVIINIGGTHAAKSVIGALIANALEQAHAQSVAHLNFDQAAFKEVCEAVTDTDAVDLHGVNAVIVEWEEDEVDNAYVENESSPIEVTQLVEPTESSSSQKISEVDIDDFLKDL